MFVCAVGNAAGAHPQTRNISQERRAAIHEIHKSHSPSEAEAELGTIPMLRSGRQAFCAHDLRTHAASMAETTTRIRRHSRAAAIGNQTLTRAQR